MKVLRFCFAASAARWLVLGEPVDEEKAWLLSKLEALEQELHQQEQRYEASEQRYEAWEQRYQEREVQLRRLDLDSRASNGPNNDIIYPLDTMWLLLCGALVMFMQAGFAMVEAGGCRAKNVQHILLKNLADVCTGTLGWFIFGYSFAYGGDDDGDGYMDNKFIGKSKFAGHHFAMPDSDPALADGKIVPTDFVYPNPYCHYFFQWTFSSAAATIVSGGVAERIQFTGYIIYSFFMTAFIYPVVVAWTWGYGWIATEVNDIGNVDFAGSGIVHMTGGVGALCGAAIGGPRFKRWTLPDDFNPHSLPLIVIGTFVLWFGWYGFNCGSTLYISSEAIAAKASLVAVNTTLGGATGGLTVVVLKFFQLKGKYDVGALCNGILAGLVSITAGCSSVDVGSAVGIGLLGGVVYTASSTLLKHLKIDDPLDAFSVHGACGAWGTLAAALFDMGDGLSYVHGRSGFTCVTQDDGTCDPAGWSKVLAANVVEILMIILWSGGLSCSVFVPLRLMGAFRVHEDEQILGTDHAMHSPSKAYSINETSAIEEEVRERVEREQEEAAKPKQDTEAWRRLGNMDINTLGKK